MKLNFKNAPRFLQQKGAKRRTTVITIIEQGRLAHRLKMIRKSVIHSSLDTRRLANRIRYEFNLLHRKRRVFGS